MAEILRLKRWLLLMHSKCQPHYRDTTSSSTMCTPCDVTGDRIFNSNERMAQSKAGMEHAMLLVHQTFLAGQDKPDLVWKPREYQPPSG